MTKVSAGRLITNLILAINNSLMISKICSEDHEIITLRNVKNILAASGRFQL